MGAARVLIAENDSANCLKCKESLQRSGFKAECLDSGEKVLNRLKTNRPEVFLLSDSLPEVNIFELCRLVKSGRLIQSIPILLLSARPLEELSKLWPELESYIDSLLVKPFTDEEVVGKVRSLMGWPDVDSYMKPDNERSSVASHQQDFSYPGPDILKKTQQELEEKALVIAQLKYKMKEMEKKLERASRGEMTRDDYLTTKVNDLELEIATKNLCLAEMEVKIEELIRLKTDFEKRAQDIIEQKVFDENELRKKYEEILGARESLQLDNASLKKGMEEAVVKKEQMEELLEAREQSWKKEKKEIEDRLTAQSGESDRQKDISRLERQLEERDEELAGIRERCRELEEASARQKELEDRLGEKDKALTSLRERCRELEEDFSVKEKDYTRSLDEYHENEGRLKCKINDLNEENEKLALALQDRGSESDGLSTEALKLREKISSLEEERDNYRKLEAESKKRAECLIGELEETRARISQKDEGATAVFEGKEELDLRLADLEKQLEEALKEKEGLLIGLESMSLRADEEAKKRKEISGRLDSEIAAMEELESRCQEASARIESMEASVGEKQNEITRLTEVIRQKEKDLESLKAAGKEMEEEFQLQLMSEREEKDALNKKDQDLEMVQAASPYPQTSSIDELRDSLMDAVKVAQREILEKSRVEADMVSRLESLKREKEDMAKRSEDELTKAREREMRLEELLNRALHVRGGESSTFLPATITSITSPSGMRRRLLAFVLTGVVIAVVIGAFLYIGHIVVDRWDAIRGAGIGKMEYGNSKVSSVETRQSIEDMRNVWRKWTRKTVSGGVLFQATLRSPEELKASIEADAQVEGWESGKLEEELQKQTRLYDFDRYYYIYIYTKNLEVGYPSYADSLERHLVLRDESGRETVGQIPEEMAEGKVIYSHTPGILAKEGSELMYEVATWLVFPKRALSPDPSLLQLIAHDIGATSRRVLTWEMIGSGE